MENADRMSKRGDIEEAIEELRKAAAVFEENFEKSPETGSEDEFVAKNAAAYVLETREEIVRLGERKEGYKALAEDMAKRDNWISENWDLFNSSVKAKIIKDHASMKNDGYDLTAKGFHDRARDNRISALRAAGFEPSKRIEAAQALAKEIVEQDKEVTRTSSEVDRNEAALVELNEDIAAKEAERDASLSSIQKLEDRINTSQDEISQIENGTAISFANSIENGVVRGVMSLTRN